jgi:hypothetical protein
MSTLKTNNIEHLDASTPSIQTTIGGGTILAGVSTVSGALNVGTGTSVSSPATNTLALGTNNTERLRITSAGLVGIGLTNPEKNLVVSSSSSPTIRINNSDSSITADQTIGVIEFKANDGSNDGDQVTGSIESIAQAAFTGQGSPSHLIFKTNGVSGANALTERLRVDSGGRLITGNYSTALDTIAGSIIVNGETSGGRIAIRGSGSSANTTLSEIFGFWDTNKVAGFQFAGGSDTTNKDDGQIKFYTSASGPSLSERLRITSAGDVQVKTGNLVIGTSGKGIDFSATADGSGTSTSELLDDYEEGTWTPSVTFGGTLASQTNQGKYTRIGNTVFISYQLNISGLSGGTGNINVSGLPYAADQVPTYSHGNCQGNASMSLPSGAGSIMPYIENGSNYMRLLYMTNSGHADVTNTVYSSGLTFYGNGIYYTS